jgi:NAD(P)-dependent dehydrogenase (short-subunit alcohol dehydrogenase family)
VIAATVSAAEIESFLEQNQGSSIEARLLDVTDNAQVERFFAGFDQLDGLVNCAGIIMRDAEYEIETFEKVINVNLSGTMRCCVAAQPALARLGSASGGAIVNTASMRSFLVVRQCQPIRHQRAALLC